MLSKIIFINIYNLCTAITMQLKKIIFCYTYIYLTNNNSKMAILIYTIQ